jgi:hypothetical protein
LPRKELLKRQKDAKKNQEAIPINNSRMNHLQEIGNDMTWAMKKQSDSDSDVKCATTLFYNNSYYSQSNRWIELKFYVESSNMLSSLELNFQVNWNSRRHRNTSQ